MDETRLQSLGDAITESYATEARPSRWHNLFRKGGPQWFVLTIILIVTAIAGAALAMAWLPGAMHEQAKQRRTHHTSTPKPVHSRAPAKDPTASPSPTAAPTDSPSPEPTATPTAIPTPGTGAAIYDAPHVVRSNRELTVGPPGSCDGQNVTIEVSDYPRGCTVFGAASSGRLKNGLGTVLIVPVRTSESAGDVLYGLLYLQSNVDSPPRFLGILPGDGTGHLVVRLQDGLIMEQNGSHTKYSTFNGRRVIWLSG